VTRSIERLLEDTARRGSWYGGGSAAALACALAGALLEKLLNRSPSTRAVRAIRLRAAAFVDEDATAFSRVIKAYYQHDQSAARAALRTATKIPLGVHASAGQLLRIARQQKRTISARYQSDLTCVVTLATAARKSARALVLTNLSWLNDPAYSRRARQQLSRAA